MKKYLFALILFAACSHPETKKQKFDRYMAMANLYTDEAKHCIDNPSPSRLNRYDKYSDSAQLYVRMADTAMGPEWLKMKAEGDLRAKAQTEADRRYDDSVRGRR